MARYQKQQITQATRDAEKAADTAARLESEVVHLRRKIDRFALTAQAMWELLQEKTELTEEDLQKRMKEIDQRDGTLDGKIGIDITDCPECERPVNSSRDTCIYCGAKIERKHRFG